jgi:hypothetical protein
MSLKDEKKIRVVFEVILLEGRIVLKNDVRQV